MCHTGPAGVYSRKGRTRGLTCTCKSQILCLAQVIERPDGRTKKERYPGRVVVVEDQVAKEPSEREQQNHEAPRGDLALARGERTSRYDGLASTSAHATQRSGPSRDDMGTHPRRTCNRVCGPGTLRLSVLRSSGPAIWKDTTPGGASLSLLELTRSDTCK